MDPAASQQNLHRLREHRNRPDTDQSLAFVAKMFRQQIEKPYKQLGKYADLWAEHVPAELAEHTRLEGFRRGVLSVVVPSAAWHYELDRALRGGLKAKLMSAGGGLRRVQVRVDTAAFSDEK